MAEIRAVNVTAAINGQDIKVSNLEVSNRVGTLATVRVTGHNAEDAKATEQSTKLSLEKFAGQAGALQAYVMQQTRNSPDVQISATDGASRMLFNGFLSAPAFAVSNGSADMLYSAVHEAAQIGFYRGDVFQQSGFGLDHAATNREKVFDPMKWTPFDGSIAQQILEQLNRMTKIFEKLGPQTVTNGVAYQLALQLEEQNAVWLPYVQRFLQASVATTRIPNITHYDFQLDTAIRRDLWRTICSEGGLLSALVNIVAKEYGLQFVCQLTGTPSARLELLGYVNAQPTTLSIPAESFSFSTGGELSLPIKGVIVKAARPPNTFTDALAVEKSNQFSTAVAFYPPNAAVSPGSRLVVLDAPNWFNSGNVRIKFDPETHTAPSSLKAFRNQHPTLAALVRKTNTDAQSILTWWAKGKFAYLSLAPAQATAHIPLNFGIQVGRVYAVQVYDSTGASGALFQGYVEGVTHRISSREGGLDASTTVYFTHVQANGYTQPGDHPQLGLQSDGIGIGNLNPAGGAIGSTR